jgi:hypothetical protein
VTEITQWRTDDSIVQGRAILELCVGFYFGDEDSVALAGQVRRPLLR